MRTGCEKNFAVKVFVFISILLYSVLSLKEDFVYGRVNLLNQTIQNNSTKNYESEFSNDNEGKKTDEDYILSTLDLKELNKYSNFSDILNEFINTGDAKQNGLLLNIVDIFAGEIRKNAAVLSKLLAIGILSAFIVCILSAVKGNEASKTGEYIVYIMTLTIIAALHIENITNTKEVLITLNDFMKVLMPVFASTVVFCAKSMTASVMYGLVLLIITIVTYVLIGFIIPLINIFLAAKTVEGILKENMAAKFAGTIGELLNISIKAVVVFIAGLSAVKSLTAPAFDELNGTVVLKAAKSIPVISGAIDSVAGTVLGAGNLVKNAVGAAGIITVIIIVGIPIIKIFAVVCMYKLVCFISGYVADDGFCQIINSGAEAAGFMLKTILCAAVMFIIAIAITAVGTVPNV